MKLLKGRNTHREKLSMAMCMLMGMRLGLIAGLWILAVEFAYSHFMLPYPIRFDGRLLVVYGIAVLGLATVGTLAGIVMRRRGRAVAAASIGVCLTVMILGLRLHDLSDAGLSLWTDGGLVVLAVVSAAIVSWIAAGIPDLGKRRAAPTVLLAGSIPAVVVAGKLLVNTADIPVSHPIPVALGLAAVWSLVWAVLYRAVVTQFLRPFVVVAMTWLIPVVVLLASGLDASVLPGTRAMARTPAADASGRPPIFWITIDTLRADHMSVNGYEIPTTPELEAFARQATVYTQCLAQAPSTSQSVPSLLAGLTPYRHGGVTDTRRLPDDVLLIPEMLRDRGYQTIGQSANPWVSEHYGIAQGFEEFRLYNTDNELIAYDLMKLAMRVAPFHIFRLREMLPSYAYKPIRPLVDDTLAFVAGRDASRPLFLYVQPVDPHGPYQPPQRYAWPAAANLRQADYVGYWDLKSGVTVSPGQLTGIVARYDSEISYSDAELGRLFRALKDGGLFDPALIVITSDHGEQFLEHNLWRHSNSLYQQLLHVPLIVKYPHQVSGTVVRDRVATVDIVPTILRALGDACEACDGRPLQERTPGSAEPIFSYLMDRHEVRPIIRSVVLGSWKLIRTDKDGAMTEELFDLEADPREIRDLRSAHPEVAARLGELITAYEAKAGPAPAAQAMTIQGADADRLRALGYIH